jgi:hypothetical protein
MPEVAYPALHVTPRSGAEPFHVNGTPAGFDLIGFWRWAVSDLASNVWRGLLAEYLVAKALGVEVTVRAEWDACDIRMADGTTVEVKSAAYFQTWHQHVPSVISFDIAPKRGWDATTNAYAPAPCRSAKVYVFALLAHQDKVSLDPLNLGQWQFYVVPTSTLDEACATQKRIGLRALARVAPPPVSFDVIKDAVVASAK